MTTEITLRQKQTRFVKYLGMLIDYAYSLPGVELTLGEGQVDDTAHSRHMVGSLHHVRLAQDLNLFVGGSYITGDHPVWHQLGTYWRLLDPLAAWGGDFASRDYNHFSLSHDGKK